MTTIRQMCETYNVTPRTLRFYEQRGLLSPIRHGNRREFTEACKRRVELILRLKGFGFSLDEIWTAYCDAAKIPAADRRIAFVRKTANSHLLRMRAERDQMDRDIAALEAALDPAQGMRAFELEGV